MHLPCRTTAVGLALLCASIGYAETTQRPPDPALYQLGAMFVEDSFAIAADLCSQRVPASRDVWVETARQWHEDHHEKLAALRKSQQTIAAALKIESPRGTPLDLGQFAMFSQQGAAFIMYGLAGASDPKAYELCESLRARYLDRKLFDQSFDQAQAAAAVALSAVSQH